MNRDVHINGKYIFSVTDLFTITIFSFYTLLAIIFFNRLENSFWLILNNLLFIAVILILSIFYKKYEGSRTILFIRRLAYIPVIYIIYIQIQNYIPLINPTLYDDMLINWDKVIFGCDPTTWIDQFSFPLLTEYLQISYMMYFILPIVMGIELHLSGRDEDFHKFFGIVVLSFYLSYLFYFIMPAIGPRFTLHNFNLLGTELPGLYITDFLRNIVNIGGGILPGAIDPSAIVNRDCMPSGHAWMTTVVIFLAYKYKVKSRLIIYIFGVSLIISTVYLRYHYAIDIIAGLILAIITVTFSPRLIDFLTRIGFRKS